MCGMSEGRANAFQFAFVTRRISMRLAYEVIGYVYSNMFNTPLAKYMWLTPSMATEDGLVCVNLSCRPEDFDGVFANAKHHAKTYLDSVPS